MIPGIAALLLARGCPEDQLDECFAMMGEWAAPTSPAQAVRDADLAISKLTIDTTAT
jgi:hypothetical protein